jgi:GT2 family glycosyltransferase
MRVPFLSLVIATVNREFELERCLASLVQDGNKGLEIIIVDQNVDDRVRRIMERYEQQLEIVHMRRSIIGASSARNAGAGIARGAWVGFPDDDAYFLPDTLRQFQHHAQAGEYDLISGMTRDDSGEPSVLPWFTRECDITKRLLRRTVAESTLFIRRALFAQCDGFDPLFGPGGEFCAEEAIDLVRRIRRDHPEARMRFFPAVCLVHANSVPYQNQKSLMKAKSYARGRGACFARHWRCVSKRRVLSEISRHAVGSLVLRGLRRRSRVDCLVGYVEGFRAYRRLQRWHTVAAISSTNTLPVEQEVASKTHWRFLSKRAALSKSFLNDVRKRCEVARF